MNATMSASPSAGGSNATATSGSSATGTMGATGTSTPVQVAGARAGATVNGLLVGILAAAFASLML